MTEQSRDLSEAVQLDATKRTIECVYFHMECVEEVKGKGFRTETYFDLLSELRYES